MKAHTTQDLKYSIFQGKGVEGEFTLLEKDLSPYNKSTDFHDADFEGADFTKAIGLHSTAKNPYIKRVFDHVNFNGAYLKGTNFKGFTLNTCELYQSNTDNLIKDERTKFIRCNYRAYQEPIKNTSSNNEYGEFIILNKNLTPWGYEKYDFDFSNANLTGANLDKMLMYQDQLLTQESDTPLEHIDVMLNQKILLHDYLSKLIKKKPLIKKEVGNVTYASF